MIESFFNNTPSIKNGGTTDERDDSVKPSSRAEDVAAAENPVLSALVSVKKIVRHKTRISDRRDGAAADLVQAIALRLWNWRVKFRDKGTEMSPDDWESFAARTAYNEINRYFAAKASAKECPLEEAAALPSPLALEGNSRAEVFSLVRELWQRICGLSVRQRRALLLHKRPLLVTFLHGGISEEEMARALDLTADEWAEVRIRLPLSDAQIARLAIWKNANGGNAKSIKSLTNSIKKARHEARTKLQKITRR